MFDPLQHQQEQVEPQCSLQPILDIIDSEHYQSQNYFKQFIDKSNNLFTADNQKAKDLLRIIILSSKE